MRKVNLISKNMSIILKGVFCIFVLFHHLLRTGNFAVDKIFELLGPLAVGGFYFLSGYGVVVSYCANGKKYIKKMLFKRIPLTYLLLVVTNLIYLGVYYLTGNPPLSVGGAVSSVLYISFVPEFVGLYSWIYFIVNLLIFYVVFVLIFSVVEAIKSIKRKAEVGAIVFVVVEVVLLVVISFVSGTLLDARAFLCFPLGLVCGAFANQIKRFFVKNRFFICVLLAFMGCTLLTFADTAMLREYVVPLIFCLFFTALVSGFDVKSKVLLWFGKNSLNVYLFHGAFFKIYDHFLEPSYMYRFLFVAVLTFALSMMIRSAAYVVKKKLVFKSKKFSAGLTPEFFVKE